MNSEVLWGKDAVILHRLIRLYRKIRLIFPRIFSIEEAILGLQCISSLIFRLNFFMISLYLLWFVWTLSISLVPLPSPSSTSSHPCVGNNRSLFSLSSPN